MNNKAEVRRAAYCADNESFPVRVEPGCDVGTRIYCKGTISGFSVATPTWFISDSSAAFAVYSWKGSYDETVGAEPLRSERVECIDNEFTSFRFGKGRELPAGDYLFRVYDPEGTVGVYVYYSNNVTHGYVFQDGYETAGEIRMMIETEEGTGELFGTIPKSTQYEAGHMPPDEYVIPKDSLIYTHEVMPDTWVFTDGLGRRSVTNREAGDPKPDKKLALFYWTWHTSREINVKPVNNQKLIEQHPEIKNDFNSTLWDEAGNWNWWNEPVWGYYVTTDEWVLRKQAELLADAGVDTVFADNTNGVSTWRESYIKLFGIWSKAMDDGVRAPKISFMFPFWHNEIARIQMLNIYSDIYLKERFRELWFYLDGKPMLMGYPDSLNPDNEMEKDMQEYFTFRRNIPEYDDSDYETSYGYWGWLSMYPQAYYYKDRESAVKGRIEQVTVGVSQNHDYVSHRLSAMNGDHIAGRSYTKDLSHMNEPDAVLYGYNFAEQFEYALKLDPEVIFVTGWNEWIANRQKEWMGVENAFPDQFSDEFSRDIEPTRGALRDHYYYQFVNYVRLFKGVRPVPCVGEEKTIDLSGGQEQWKDVEPYYAAYIGNTGNRNHAEPGRVISEDYSGRNDIIGAQVSRDADYLYFNVECRENITPYTDNLWMTLYIDSIPDNQGWCSFDYVINKSPASDRKAVLERFTGDGYKSEKTAECDYAADGRFLTVRVRKADINVSGDFTVNFAWTDNVHDRDDVTRFSGDILDFYTSGDVAPGGRFKYSYDTSRHK